MNTNVKRCFALLAALLMLAICLPVSGLAEEATHQWNKKIMGGTYVRYNLVNSAVDEIADYLDYTKPVEELNQELTFRIDKIGKGIQIVESCLVFEPKTLENGYTYYADPYVKLEASGEADGESLVFSVYVKSEKTRYTYEYTFDVETVAMTPIVSATAATELKRAENGSYELTAEEGSVLTVTPVYEDKNGQKLSMNVVWGAVDTETGKVDLLSRENTYTCVVTQDLSGKWLGWYVELPSANKDHDNWITLTVVPKGTLTQTAAAVPNTGDDAKPMLWLAGMLMAGIGCAMLLKRRQNS